MMSLKPPVVPRPSIGGEPNIVTMAPRPSRWLLSRSAAAMASAESSGPLRWSNCFSKTYIAPNLGSMYVLLKQFDQRSGPELSADAIAAALRERSQREGRGAIVTMFGSPPIDGLGTTGGFKLIIEDRGHLGLEELQRVSDQIVARGNNTPGLEGLYNSSRASTPWLYLEIDRTKCMTLGVLVSDVFSTLQVYLGSYYVNNFNEFGRIWQVNIQADPPFRDRLPDIRQLKVRNNHGQRIRLGTLLSVRNTTGPVSVMRYNMSSPTPVTANTSPGTSSGH